MCGGGGDIGRAHGDSQGRVQAEVAEMIIAGISFTPAARILIYSTQRVSAHSPMHVGIT